MMRRIIACVLIWFLVIGCSSCGEPGTLLDKKFDTDEYLPDYDVQMEYVHSGGNFTKNDSIYYIKINTWLFYYDEVTSTSGKLCGKAECLHNDKQCNAYIGDGVGLQIYDNHIYWNEGSVLYCCDLNGNNREQVQTLSTMWGINPYFAIHRGYVYSSIMENVVIDGKGYVEFTLRQNKLGDDDNETVIYKKAYERMILAPQCRFYRNRLFLLIEHDAVGDYLAFDRELMVYDIEAQEWSSIIEETSPWFTKSIFVNDTGIHMMEFNGSDSSNLTVRRVYYDLDTESREISNAMELKEGFVGATALENYNVLYTGALRRGQETWEYQIYDLKWNLVRTGESQGEKPICVGSDTNRVIFKQTYWVDGTDGLFYKITNVPLESEQKDAIWIDFFESGEEMV